MDVTQIEDIYPLSTMQQSLLRPQAGSGEVPSSGQLSCTFKGELDVAAFKTAWQQAAVRHPILRTSFISEGLEQAVQVVNKEAEIILEQHDWRELSVNEQQERLVQLQQAERDKTITPSVAPLMRLVLIATASDNHKFVWTYHPLALDAASAALVLRDVLTDYQRLCEGHKPQTEEGQSYWNYVDWLGQQDVAEAEVFWKQYLQGVTAPTPLSVERNHGPQEKLYEEQQINLTNAELALCEVLRRTGELQLSTIVQGAWALLLSRYSGDDDVTFGITVSGRPAEVAGVESIAGPFANSLPVRMQVKSETSVLAWLIQLETQLRTLRRYEHCSLAQVKSWSEAPPELPLFESCLILENHQDLNPALLSQLAGIEVSDGQISEPHANAIHLRIGFEPEVSLRLSYDASRFDAATIKRMLDHWRNLLSAMVTTPEVRLSDLPILSATEEQQLLVDFNQTTTAYPNDVGIHELFEQQVERTPDATAVVYGDEAATYRQLNERANQLAHHLLELGAGAEVRVGLMAERGIEMVVGLLGILKAGGAYVPLDTDYPAERLRWMIDDSEVPVLVTQQRLLEKIPEQRARVVLIDAEWDQISKHSTENPAIPVSGDNLAYVIYTSGSTGRPKGAAIPHAAVNRLVRNTNYVQIEAHDRIGQASNISFDAATFEVWGALLNGAQLIGVSKDLAISPLEFAEQIRRQEISVLFLTTALFNQLAGASPNAFASLSSVMFGGEACDPKRVREVLKNGPPARLLHVYGPTESTTFTSWHLVEEVREGATTVPIGSPISNTQIHLLDKQLKPVPIGVPGELYIGGDGLARGYLNQPEFTAERFIPNPYSVEGGTRLYKTGDQGRYLSDGSIEFIGRIDRQVKIRGFRIEVEEIETVLQQHPAVKETVVVVRENENGDKTLVAYVVADHDLLPVVGELRSFLKEHLPEYMLPSAFVRLEELPLTPNGKINRQALPAPENTRPELEINFVAPSTPIEEVLADIWCSILNVEQVGVEDNFFELGGHSLLATQVNTRIRKAFRIDLPLRSIFESPTVASLAECVKRSLRGGQSLQAPPIMPVSRDEEVPLSFAQQRLWFLDQLEPGSSAYNIPAAVRLRGALNITALEQTLTEITRRHEAVRTVFASIEGQPLQVVMPAQAVKLPVVDLSEMPDGEREAEAQRLADEEARLGFDLSQGPLLRTRLLKLGEEEHVLLFTMHHIITDGWSMEILIREAAMLYAAYADGHSSPLPELPIQYADFAHWQRSWLQGEVLEAELAYWKKQLAGAPAALELPTDHPRPVVQSNSGASQSLTLSTELTASLKELTRREGVTQFMMLLAAFQTLLHRYSGQSHISTGSPIANRNRGETEGLIGFFVNTLVMCTDLSSDPSFRALLRRVREVALGAYAHQDVPFEKLVEELQPERDPSVTPLFQVMFNLVRFTEDEAGIELPGLIVETLPPSESGSKFDLTLYAQEHYDRIHMNLVYNSDLFEYETITRMLGHFETLLKSVVATPDKSISALPLLTDDERRRLLDRRNSITPVRPYKEFTRNEIEQAITERFQQQVLRAPTQIAVKTRRHSWSYLDLSRRADVIAAALLGTCGEDEGNVALLFPHDAPMIAAMLGALQSGNAYVPLDASFPVERLTFMIQDAQARVLLTDSTHLALARELANGLPVINLDELDFAGPPARPVTIDPQRRAYLLYTSGSTGQPKAVVQNHRNVLHHIRCYTNSLHIDAADKLSLLPAYGFDASVMDIFGALLNGATLCPFDLKAEGPEALASWMRDEQITIYHSTPTVFRHLAASLNGSELSHARLVVLGGEAASKRDVEIFNTHFPANSLFINGMGPTESTLALQYFVGRETELQRENVPVGYPVQDTQVRLVNEFGHEVEIYGAGEIEIHSDHVALGYWQQPELTAAAFGVNEEGKRKYRTGDLGRRLPDGQIEYLGRKDLQVKIRGHRIEIGEVERALTEHEDIRQAVVIARADDGGEKRLVAYVVCRDGRRVTSSELRRRLETMLPGHMIPSVFMTLDELPLLMNGKIDRNALPAPDNVRPELDAEFVTPHTEIERAVAAIWQDVLKVEKVGIYDNFFDLGGHSLLVVQVHSRLRELFKSSLSLIEMFSYPTISSLARHLGQRPNEEPALQRSVSRAESRRELLNRRTH